MSTWPPSAPIRDDIARRIQQLLADLVNRHATLTPRDDRMSRVQLPLNISDIGEAVACPLAAVTAGRPLPWQPGK